VLLPGVDWWGLLLLGCAVGLGLLYLLYHFWVKAPRQQGRWGAADWWVLLQKPTAVLREDVQCQPCCKHSELPYQCRPQGQQALRDVVSMLADQQALLGVLQAT
jgi:hypothetical protein